VANYYYGNDLLPEIPVVSGKPYYFIRRNNNYYKYEVFYASSQFYYDSSVTSIGTKDGSNCARYELAMGADGVWTYADESHDSFGVEAGRDCIFANTDVFAGASTTDVWLTGMTPKLDNSGEGNFYYGTVLLPKLPVIYGYPNVWIRKNNSTGRYDAIYSTVGNEWYYDGDMTPVSSSKTVYWYRIFIDGGTEWMYSQTTTGAFGVDANRPAIWSRYDVPSGSISAVEIYLAGSEPEPEFPPVVEIGTRYLVKDNIANILYTVVDGVLSEVNAGLTADTFIQYGSDAIPESSLLLTLDYFSVLAWNEEYTPEIVANVTATPNPQMVISDRIYLDHQSITGIKNVTANCEGELKCAVSIDGRQNWQKWNGTEWRVLSGYVYSTWQDCIDMTWDECNNLTWNDLYNSGYIESNDGMSKEVLEGITTEQWDELIAGVDGMYIRVALANSAQVVKEIKINFNQEV
jgi:hypothetical protein